MTGNVVLVLIPNLGTGGAQKVFRQQLGYLSQNYVVHGCVFNWDGALPDDKGLTIHSLGVPGGSNVVKKAWYFLLRIIRLRRLKKKLNVGVSISHLEGADYVNVLSSRGEIVLCWVHGTKKFDENISGRVGWLRKNVLIPLLYSRAHNLVAVSKGIFHELVDTFGLDSDKIRTVYNGFYNDEIQSAKEEVLRDDVLQIMREKTVVMHCRLSVQKNIFALLKIFAQVKERTNAHLVILGDGELRTDLISESELLGMKTFSIWRDKSLTPDYDVYFLGYQSNPYKFLSKASLYVMSSGWEGFPLALCEALACGVPVVSTDCYTGPREILAPSMTMDSNPVNERVDGEFGILMPLANESDAGIMKYWANSIAEILADDELRARYAIAGPPRVLEFDMEKVVNEVTGIIEKQRESK